MRLLKINRNDGTGKVDTIGTYGLSVAVQDGLDKINLRYLQSSGPLRIDAISVTG